MAGWSIDIIYQSMRGTGLSGELEQFNPDSHQQQRKHDERPHPAAP
jgi:hypothetical protein